MSDPRVIEVYRTPMDTRLWQSWVSGEYVVWMESLGPGSTSALGYSQSPAYGTCLKYARSNDNEIGTVLGSTLQPPPVPRGSYRVVLPVSWASVLPHGLESGLRVVWSLPPAELGPEFAFRSLLTWSGGSGTTQLPLYMAGRLLTTRVNGARSQGTFAISVGSTACSITPRLSRTPCGGRTSDSATATHIPIG